MTVFKTPLHPGEILREEFLTPLDMSAGQLAKAIDVPRTRIERIVREEMGISADTALRLARYFGTSPELWLNLQQSYEIAVGATALSKVLLAIQPREGANENSAGGRTRRRAIAR
jgi:addiction module HigA family antidote